MASSHIVLVEPSGEILFEGRSLLSEPPAAEVEVEVEVEAEFDVDLAWDDLEASGLVSRPAFGGTSGERPTLVPGGDDDVEPCPPTMRSAQSGFFSTRERREKVRAA